MAPNVAPKTARFSETNRANAGQPNRETPRISKGFIAFSGCLGKVALERVKGIEPSSSAWEAAALPLSYTRESRFPPFNQGECLVNILHPGKRMGSQLRPARQVN